MSEDIVALFFCKLTHGAMWESHMQ